jgi:hypothetical protein
VKEIEIKLGGKSARFVYREVFANDGLSATATHTAMRILQSAHILTVSPCIAVHDPKRGVNFNIMLFGQPRYLDGSQYLRSLFLKDPTGELMRKFSAQLRSEMQSISIRARELLLTRSA